MESGRPLCGAETINKLMIKLELEIEHRLIEAELTMAGDRASLSFDGQTHEAEVSEPEPGTYVVICNHRVYRCQREQPHGGEERFLVNGKSIAVLARDKKHLRGHEAHTGGQTLLTSPMPGKVVNVLLGAGNKVEALQGVIVVEAMKMQNEVQSPRAGKIVEMRVAVGQTVNAGEVLAVVE